MQNLQNEITCNISQTLDDFGMAIDKLKTIVHQAALHSILG